MTKKRKEPSWLKEALKRYAKIYDAFGNKRKGKK